ncbi:MAG TPA: enoyl-CoA hydratase/isomerase family protein [Pseudorhodoferax sp.]|nr:enoyl-CoA hydratase/isomerase family protein [Pseudorhodoferax sp.]
MAVPPEYHTLRYGLTDGVGVLTLNRPYVRNAICMDMRAELADLVGRLHTDPTLRVLVLTGADGHFCAGGDLRALEESARRGETDAVARRQRLVDLGGLVTGLLQFDKPIVAAVQGVAYGAGIGLALTADLVLAADDARISFSFGRLGLVPDFGILYSLPRIVGLQRAKELVFSGREIDGRAAQALGLVLEACPSECVLQRALTIAHALAAASPLALSIAKRALNAAPGNDLATMLTLEADGQGIAMSSPYHQAALARFHARQAPAWQWPEH